MRHRHLTTTEWTRAAIDSCLERGDLPDWRELFDLVRTDRELAVKVYEQALLTEERGTRRMACHLVRKLWPDIPRTALDD